MPRFRYALYVIHPLTMYGWLGSGGTLVKYAKRPLCLALTFGLAHLSTFAYERRWMAFGKQLSHRWDRRAAEPRPPQSTACLTGFGRPAVTIPESAAGG